MLCKSIHLTVRSLQGVSRVISLEPYSNIHIQKYSRYVSRKPATIVNEDDIFDVSTDNTYLKTPKPEKKTKLYKARLKATGIKQEIEEKFTTKAEEVNFDEINEPKRSNNLHKTKLFDNEKLVS